MNTIATENSFLEKIEQDLNIEPRDVIPEKYRTHLIPQTSLHAHSEQLTIHH